MDNNIYKIMNKGKVVSIRFRNKIYEVEGKSGIEISKEILADNSDFYEVYTKAKKGTDEDIKIISINQQSKKGKYSVNKGIKAGCVALAGVAIVFAATSCNPKDNKNTSSDEGIVTEETLLDETKSVEPTSSILDEIIASLKEGPQKDAWTKISEFQDYFNNVASPSISIEEDNGAQLHLTAEQCIALFTRFNATQYTNEEMASIYGNSAYFTFANMDDNFKEACKVLNYYYLTATNTTGLDNLFVSEKDGDLFSDFEELILNYNENRTDENKNALHDYLIDEIYYNPLLSNPRTENPGACSAIGTAVVPILHATKVINEEELNHIIEVNETITCDMLKEHVEGATKTAKEVTLDNQDVIKELPKMLDEEYIKVNNLNINFEKRYEDLLGDLYGTDYTNSAGKIFDSNNENKPSNSSFNNYSSGNASSFITEADKEFEEQYGEENKKEEAYGKGLMAVANSSLYDKAYDYVSTNGVKPSISNYEDIINSIKNNYTGSYKTSFNNGVDTGSTNTINNAYTDAMAEYNKTHEQVVTPTEAPVATEELVSTEAPVATEEPVPTEAPVAIEEPVPTEAPVAIEEPVPTEAPVIMTEEYISQEQLESLDGQALVRSR